MKLKLKYLQIVDLFRVAGWVTNLFECSWLSLFDFILRTRRRQVRVIARIVVVVYGVRVGVCH
jgi:hypothetical protein